MIIYWWRVFKCLENNEAVVKVIDLSECRQYVICNDNQSLQRMQLIGFTDASRKSLLIYLKKKPTTYMGLLLTDASDRHIAYHYAIMIPRHHNSNARISPTCFSSSCDFCISLINRISLCQLMNCNFWIYEYVDYRDCRTKDGN